MRFSKNFKHENYFTQKNNLSPRAAIFFVIEESFLLFLIVLQIYAFLGMKVIEGKLLFFQTEPLLQNYLWFFGSIAFFLIGYFIIAVRDKYVWLIHHNFSRLLFGTIKLKITMTTLKIFIFSFTELVFSILIALSIFLYLDPEININYPNGTPIPFELKLISFIILIAISILFFSHSKEFRKAVYGPTPIQKRLHLGKHEIKRTTHTKSGYLRFSEKKRRS